MRRVLGAALAVGLATAACISDGALFGPEAAPSSTTVVTTTTVPGSTTVPGTDPTTTTTTVPPTGPTTAPTTTTTTVPPRRLTIDELVALTIEDLEEFWALRLPETFGVDYREVSATIPYSPSTGNLPDCGGQDLPADIAAGNAFYCSPDDYVAWDAEGLFPDLWTEFGDFAVALVLAHEWGHAIQARADVRGPTIMTELQADCLAGAWTSYVDEGGQSLLGLESGDLEEAMAGYLLFRDPPGTSPTDPAAHGSAFDRVNAFQDGFFNGIATCAAYERGAYEVVDIPLTTADLQTGGDLPFDEVGPLLAGALETYWVATFPAVFGAAWMPVVAMPALAEIEDPDERLAAAAAALGEAESGPYLPSSGSLPACGDDVPDPEVYRDNAFYCPEDDFVAWDGENLFPNLYQSIGDFALGMVLAHEWATAVQWRAGLPIDGLDAELQADCLSGSWAAELVSFDNPTGIVLSAGDLDEAVSGFLAFSDEPGGAAMTGTAFQRFDAFEDGFFNGPRACLGS